MWLIHIYYVLSFMYMEHACILKQAYTMNYGVGEQHSRDLEDSSIVSGLFSHYLRSFKNLSLWCFDSLNVSSLEAIFKNSPIYDIATYDVSKMNQYKFLLFSYVHVELDSWLLKLSCPKIRMSINMDAYLGICRAHPLHKGCCMELKNVKFSTRYCLDATNVHKWFMYGWVLLSQVLPCAYSYVHRIKKLRKYILKLLFKNISYAYVTQVLMFKDKENGIGSLIIQYLTCIIGIL